MNQKIYEAIKKINCKLVEGCMVYPHCNNCSNAKLCNSVAKIIAGAISDKKGVDKMNFGRNMSFIQGVENGNVYGHNTFHDQILENLEEKK